MAKVIIIMAALLALLVTLVPLVMMALPMLSALAVAGLMFVIIWVCVKLPWSD